MLRRHEQVELSDYEGLHDRIIPSLVRNPSNYEGQIIRIRVRIEQELVGGLLREAGYRGTDGGNEWYITYDLPDGAPRILVGDTVTFYGEFDGLRAMRRALTGVREYIPNLVARYHVIG